MGTHYIQIPGGVTSAFQPCDVGIMKPFETLFKVCHDWKLAEYTAIVGTSNIPVPGRVEVSQFLDKIWREFSNEIILNSFSKCGFGDEFDIDIGPASEFV